MIKKEMCCGCSACEQICPVKCIAMEEDERGFLYPKADLKECIHCGKCDKVCPAQQISGEEKNWKNSSTLVGYAKDTEIRKHSSSGGIFSMLAETILQENGVVFGAAFNAKFQVHHIFVDSEDDLWKLRGSKYVQSNLENTFQEAKVFLQEGRCVLFTGTACQIAGLKNYLGREYERLYMVDVLCHGVPSPKIWKKYLDDKKNEYKSEIQQVEFRNKQAGWKQYFMKISFADGLCYDKVFYEDSFMKMFLSDICLRPSCYQCVWKKIPRESDLSLGDCWGVEQTMPQMDDDRGTSIILVHSQKGKQLLQRVSSRMCLCNAQLDTVLSPRADSRRPVLHHPNEQKFWTAVAQGKSMSELEKYENRSFIQKVIGVIQNRIRK